MTSRTSITANGLCALMLLGPVFVTTATISVQRLAIVAPGGPRWMSKALPMRILLRYNFTKVDKE